MATTAKILTRLFFASLFLSLSSGNAPASNASLPDNFPLAELTIVGAHNAAQSSEEGWVYAQQSQTLEALFKGGARFFKVPIHWYAPSQGIVGNVKTGLKKIGNIVQGKSSEKPSPFIALCHEYPGHNNCRLSILQRGGQEPQPALQFFKNVVSLAKKNPKEIIILKLEEYLFHNSEKNGTKDYSKEEVISALDSLLKESGLAQIAYKLTPSKLPTLGEMRNAGKTVIIFIDNDKEADDKEKDVLVSGIPYLNLFNSFVNQTHWETKKLANCDMASHSESNPLTEVNINPEMSFPHHTVQGKILSPLNKVIKTDFIKPTDYKKLHSQENIQKRLDTCEVRHGFRGNILTSDHIQHGELAKFVNDRNQKALGQLGTKQNK